MKISNGFPLHNFTKFLIQSHNRKYANEEIRKKDNARFNIYKRYDIKIIKIYKSFLIDKFSSYPLLFFLGLLDTICSLFFKCIMVVQLVESIQSRISQ